jgi:FkbM family methyltransferase
MKLKLRRKSKMRDQTGVSLVEVPGKTIVPTHCKHGDFVYPCDTYIGKGLEIYGEYSEFEVELLQGLLEPGDVVVEAGANIGAITVPLAKAVGPGGCVIAYEPQTDIAAMLLKNLDLNKLHVNVEVVEAGLGARNTVLHYSPNDLNTGGVSLESEGKCPAQVFTLDMRNLDCLKLLKIDVEGMETEVLRGARETIKHCRPIIYCENDRAQNAQRLLGTLFSYRYRVFRHDPPLYNPNNFRNVRMNLWQNVVSMNLLCIPEEHFFTMRIPLSMPEITRDKSWVAVCRFGGVGDNLVAASVLPMLSQQGYKVEVITNKTASAVFENNPHINKLSTCEDDDQPPTGSLEWHKWFVKRGHEYEGGLFHLSHTIEVSLALAAAQVQFWWSPAMRRRLCDKSYLEMAADVCGVDYNFGDPLYYPTPAETARALADKATVQGERAVAWVLSGSRIDKIYPQSAWAIARIIKELDVPVMLSGCPGKDFELAKLIQADVRKQNGSDKGLHLALSHSLEDQNWPLRRSLAQLLVCDLVIGPDTGSMWAVAMAKMPKIVLLSHASPTNITKHWANTVSLHADQNRVPCWPCHRLHDSIETCTPNADKTGVACMSDISVDRLVAAARSALNGR